MRLGRIVLGVSLALSTAAFTQAGTLTTEWSDWTAAGNPGFSSATKTGVLTPTTSGFAATLNINNTGSSYGGLYTDYFYTGAAAAGFALSSTLQSSGVTSLSLSVAIDAAGNSFTETPTLNIGGQTYTFSTQNNTAGLYTVVWNLSGLGTGSFAQGAQYEINWRLGAHSAFSEISTSQTSPDGPAAVPEPTACAMMLIGLAGVGVAARRRRVAAR